MAPAAALAATTAAEAASAPDEYTSGSSQLSGIVDEADAEDVCGESAHSLVPLALCVREAPGSLRVFEEVRVRAFAQHGGVF